MTLILDPDGPDLDPDDAKAGDVISNSCWNGQWSDEDAAGAAAALDKTRQYLGKLARGGNSLCLRLRLQPARR